MRDKLLNQQVQEYINANLNTDLHSLLLKKSPFPGVSMQEIVQQIKGKQVAQKKFPFSSFSIIPWYKPSFVSFPIKLKLIRKGTITN